jgi:hypothetical protein
MRTSESGSNGIAITFYPDDPDDRQGGMTANPLSVKAVRVVRVKISMKRRMLKTRFARLCSAILLVQKPHPDALTSLTINGLAKIHPDGMSSAARSARPAPRLGGQSAGDAGGGVGRSGDITIAGNTGEKEVIERNNRVQNAPTNSTITRYEMKRLHPTNRSGTPYHTASPIAIGEVSISFVIRQPMTLDDDLRPEKQYECTVDESEDDTENWPEKNRQPESLPALLKQIVTGQGMMEFDPNTLQQVAMEKLAFVPLHDVRSELSGKPAVIYRSFDLELKLSPAELRRLILHDLHKREFFTLLNRYGMAYEWRGDFYDPETGVAEQPIRP